MRTAQLKRVIGKIIEAELGIAEPWYVAEITSDPNKRLLKVRIEYRFESGIVAPGGAQEHATHEIVSKHYRCESFFQHECKLDLRVPILKLPDGSVRELNPLWAAKLSLDSKG